MPLQLVETRLEPTDNRAEMTIEHGRAGMAAVFQIAENWGFNNTELRAILGSPSKATFFKWKSGNVRALSHDTMARLSLILGIHKALRILYANHAVGDDWINRPNAFFGGETAKARLAASEMMDLAAVRDHLNATLGGWS